MTVPEAGAPLAAVPTIWGNVPARNKNFTGRVDILAHLREGAPGRRIVVLPEENPDDPLPQAVQGWGGVGKTAIAIEYAWRYRSHYDLVWWIPADQLPSVRASLAALAARLRLELPSAAGIDGAIGVVLDALRRGDPYARWLLVFDNADQPEDIGDLIPSGPGHVLITSRNHRWQSVINTVSMDVFARTESVEFLGKRVPRGLSQADANRLAEKLGDLPLALEQAGAMLSETGMPVDEYLRLLDEHVTQIMSEGKSPDYPHPMTAAWKLSVNSLQQRLPEARELLRCCAFFGPEPIPRNVFRRGAGSVRTQVAKVISDPILLARAIRELGRYALVTLDGQSILVHRLIQALLRDELTAEEQADYQHDAQLILAAATPPDPDDARSWPTFRQLLPHVNSESTELPKSREPMVRNLARFMMRYLVQSGDYASATELIERFIEQWTKDSGPEDSDVLRAQRHQGNVLRLLGRYPDSYKLTQETLRSCRAIMGESDPTTLSLRAAFGADLRARGNFQAALELDTESRRLHDKAFGPEDSRSLRLLSCLALDHGLNSDYDTARELYQRAFQGMSGPESDSTAVDVLGAYIGMAWALRHLGRYQEAFDVGQEAVDYGRDPDGLGAEHLATLRSINNFTIVSRRFPDKRGEALEIARDTLELSTRLFGESHPDTLAIAVSLSNLLRAIDKKHHGEAVALAEATVAKYPGVYGEDHPYTYGCMSNLALLKRETGDAAGARELDERALAALEALLGREHHYTLTVAVNLASDHARLRQPDEARRIGEDALPKLTARLGAEHPLTLACMANLALDLTAAGDDASGELVRDRVLELYGQAPSLGTDHPDAKAARDRTRLDPDFDPPAI
jgi:tetratricopeptide (TPR) repeat protein